MTTKLRARIFETALSLAHSRGYQYVYRWRIAALVGCSEGIVSYHFKTMAELREAIIAHALSNKDYELIAQGYVTRHPLVMKASKILIRRALRS